MKKVKSTIEKGGRGKPVQISKPDYVFFFPPLGSTIICRLYKLSISDQT